jgi:hypothetical protein
MSEGRELETPRPIRDGVWTDSDGNRWRRRGERDATSVKRVEHLMLSSDVAVLLFYGSGRPTEVSPSERMALWERMRPYLRGPLRRAPGDQTDFRVAEFKDDQRRSLLVIEESC